MAATRARKRRSCRRKIRLRRRADGRNTATDAHGAASRTRRAILRDAAPLRAPGQRRVAEDRRTRLRRAAREAVSRAAAKKRGRARRESYQQQHTWRSGVERGAGRSGRPLRACARRRRCGAAATARRPWCCGSSRGGGGGVSRASWRSDGEETGRRGRKAAAFASREKGAPSACARRRRGKRACRGSKPPPLQTVARV